MCDKKITGTRKFTSTINPKDWFIGMVDSHIVAGSSSYVNYKVLQTSIDKFRGREYKFYCNLSYEWITELFDNKDSDDFTAQKEWCRKNNIKWIDP